MLTHDESQDLTDMFPAPRPSSPPHHLCAHVLENCLTHCIKNFVRRHSEAEHRRRDLIPRRHSGAKRSIDAGT
eukprot:40982-Pelagomonas_calceolata.AAC.1